MKFKKKVTRAAVPSLGAQDSGTPSFSLISQN